MSSSLPALFVLVIVFGLMACAWIFTRKGENQTWAFVSLLEGAVLTMLWFPSQADPDSPHARFGVLLSHVDGDLPRSGASVGE